MQLLTLIINPLSLTALQQQAHYYHITITNNALDKALNIT